MMKVAATVAFVSTPLGYFESNNHSHVELGVGFKFGAFGPIV